MDKEVVEGNRAGGGVPAGFLGIFGSTAWR